MRNSKAKLDRFKRNFSNITPEQSASLIVEVSGTIRRATAPGQKYYFLSVDQCPICGKRHDYHHITKETLEESHIINPFYYHDVRTARCYEERVFTKDQIQAGYKIPSIHVSVDLTTPEHCDIVRKIIKNEC